MDCVSCVVFKERRSWKSSSNFRSICAVKVFSSCLMRSVSSLCELMSCRLAFCVVMGVEVCVFKSTKGLKSGNGMCS